MKKLLFLLLLCTPAFAAVPGVTLTGNMSELTGSADVGSITVTLENFGSYIPVIPGYGTVSPVTTTAVANSSGVYNLTLWGNYQISPANTYYQITVTASNGSQVRSAAYQFTGAGSYDISSMTPLTANPGSPIIQVTNYLAFDYSDAEIPSGVENGSNTTFTLLNIPSPVQSLQLYLNGVLLKQGSDYTVSSLTITMAAAPQSGDQLLAWYYYGSVGAQPGYARLGAANTFTAAQTFTGNITATGQNSFTAYNLDNIIFVDGGKYALSPAGIQAAITQASSNGGGTVILPPTIGTPIAMGSTELLLMSNVCVRGSGRDATVLQWTGTANAIGATGGLQNACVRDLTLAFTSGASVSSAGFRFTANDGSSNLVWYNTFRDIHIIFNSSASATTEGFFVTSAGSGTDFVLNTIEDVWVDGANGFASCAGCEGNFWTNDICQNCGWNNGNAIFSESGLEADEHLDVRMESGSGNATGLICYATDGSNNIVRLTCDGNNSGTAIDDTGSYNIYDVTTVGLPTLGTIPATSLYRYANSANGGNITSPGQINLSPKIVSALPSASSNAGAMFYVSDSTSVSAEGQTCVGSSTNKALAFSNGSVWKCF